MLNIYTGGEIFFEMVAQSLRSNCSFGMSQESGLITERYGNTNLNFTKPIT